MLENLTKRARRTLFFARHEAVRASSAVIASEHLLVASHGFSLLTAQRFIEDAIFNCLIQDRETAKKELVARPAGETVVVDAREGVWG
jgi:hypothetical protein